LSVRTWGLVSLGKIALRGEFGHAAGGVTGGVVSAVRAVTIPCICWVIGVSSASVVVLATVDSTAVAAVARAVTCVCRSVRAWVILIFPRICNNVMIKFDPVNKAITSRVSFIAGSPYFGGLVATFWLVG